MIDALVVSCGDFRLISIGKCSWVVIILTVV